MTSHSKKICEKCEKYYARYQEANSKLDSGEIKLEGKIWDAYKKILVNLNHCVELGWKPKED